MTMPQEQDETPHEQVELMSDGWLRWRCNCCRNRKVLIEVQGNTLRILCHKSKGMLVLTLPVSLPLPLRSP